MTAQGSTETALNEAGRFVERWQAIWRDHDGERWPGLLHDRGVLRNPLGEIERQDLPEYMSNLVSGIQDHEIKPVRWGETIDGVLIEWVMRGRLPSGAFEIHGADRFTLRDGRAVEGVAYFDPRPLLEGLSGKESLMNTLAPGDVEAIARDYDAAWNAKDLDAIISKHAEGGTYRLPHRGRTNDHRT